MKYKKGIAEIVIVRKSMRNLLIKKEFYCGKSKKEKEKYGKVII